MDHRIAPVHPARQCCNDISAIPVGRKRKSSGQGCPTCFCSRSSRSWRGPIPTARSTASSTFTCIGSSRPIGLNWRIRRLTPRCAGCQSGCINPTMRATSRAVFRLHAQILNESGRAAKACAWSPSTARRCAACFDKFTDTRPAHLVSAFAADSALVLGHHRDRRQVQRQSRPSQRLLGELGLRANSVVTVECAALSKKTFERETASKAIVTPESPR